MRAEGEISTARSACNGANLETSVTYNVYYVKSRITLSVHMGPVLLAYISSNRRLNPLIKAGAANFAYGH